MSSGLTMHAADAAGSSDSKAVESSRLLQQDRPSVTQDPETLARTKRNVRTTLCLLVSFACILIFLVVMVALQLGKAAPVKLTPTSSPPPPPPSMQFESNYILPVEGGVVDVPLALAQAPEYCQMAIIGGGPGGVYAAYRLLYSDQAQWNSSVCLFEVQGRVGGRILSLRGLGSRRDMVVDVGAYRYLDGRQVLVQGIVENLLKLNYSRYDPISDSFREIVDGKGDTVGYVTFVEGLANLALARGLRLMYNHELARIDKVPTDDSAYLLTFTNGKSIKAGSVILNLAPRPLFRVLQQSGLARTTPWNNALFMPFPLMAVKVYLYYEDAWWVYMNKTRGYFGDPQPADNNDTSLFTDMRLQGRYHDGSWKCTDKQQTKCWGFLLTMYQSDISYSPWVQGYESRPSAGIPWRYFLTYGVNPDKDRPYVVLDNRTQMGAHLLSTAHARLLQWHASNNASIPEPYASQLPTQAVVAVWDPQTAWAGAAWHWWKNGILGDRDTAIAQEACHPYPDERIYVANEAFSPQQGWAEGALVMTENIVTTHLGLPPPTFIPEDRHPCVLWSSYNFNRTHCSTSLNPIQGFV